MGPFDVGTGNRVILSVRTLLLCPSNFGRLRFAGEDVACDNDFVVSCSG